MCLSNMYQKGFEQQLGPVTLVHEGILLPNDMRLDYSDLTPTEDGDWFYGPKRVKIYGGKMLENIIQALARIVLGEHLLKIEAAGITTVSSTHDEPIMLVREEDAEEGAETVRKIMTTSPDWCSEVPLEVDIGWAKEYSK